MLRGRLCPSPGLKEITMKNLTDDEISRIKDVLFKWLDSDNLQTWATAAGLLIQLGGISAQEMQSEALEYMKKAMQAIERTEKKET